MTTLDNVSAATKLRREQMDVQTELDQKRSEYRERMDRVREREQQLAKRRQELQDKLVRFYKFIQENEIKKNRADKKAQAEMKAKEEKHQLIVQLNEDGRRLEQEKQELKDKLQRYQKYQKYLDEVLQQNEEYSDPNDIISRWKTLDGNHKELQARKSYLEQQMEIQRQVLQKKKESKATEILDFTNALANKGKQLEQLHREVTKAQDEIEYSLEKKTSTTKTIGQIKMATQNLYDRCFENASKFRPIRKHGSKEEEGGEEILQQLQFIGECLGDYIYIRDKHREEQRLKKGIIAAHRDSADHTTMFQVALLVLSVSAVTSTDDALVSFSVVGSNLASARGTALNLALLVDGVEAWPDLPGSRLRSPPAFLELLPVTLGSWQLPMGMEVKFTCPNSARVQDVCDAWVFFYTCSQSCVTKYQGGVPGLLSLTPGWTRSQCAPRFETGAPLMSYVHPMGAFRMQLARGESTTITLPGAEDGEFLAFGVDANGVNCEQHMTQGACPTSTGKCVWDGQCRATSCRGGQGPAPLCRECPWEGVVSPARPAADGPFPY